MIIRRELPRDRSAIHAVHAAAFARPGGEVAAEARLVDDLRRDGDVVPALSLLALAAGEVVGHVLGSRGHIGTARVVGLGPLGVLPGRQRRGVGQALMHAVVAAADALEEPCVVLLGDPAYYSRFGFEPAGPLGVHPQDRAWTEHFQLRRLAAWEGTLGGIFRYAPAFDRL